MSRTNQSAPKGTKIPYPLFPSTAQTRSNFMLAADADYPSKGKEGTHMPNHNIGDGVGRREQEEPNDPMALFEHHRFMNEILYSSEMLDLRKLKETRKKQGVSLLHQYELEEENKLLNNRLQRVHTQSGLISSMLQNAFGEQARMEWESSRDDWSLFPDMGHTTIFLSDSMKNLLRIILNSSPPGSASSSSSSPLSAFLSTATSSQYGLSFFEEHPSNLPGCSIGGSNNFPVGENRDDDMHVD